jgi:hypothetical protein
MRPLAQRVLDAPSSATVRIADLAAALRRKGVDVIDLSAGRASEHTPEEVCEVAAQALSQGDTHQTPAQGKPEFRAVCARKLARENGIAADPEKNIIYIRVKNDRKTLFLCRHLCRLCFAIIADELHRVVFFEAAFSGLLADRFIELQILLNREIFGDDFCKQSVWPFALLLGHAGKFSPQIHIDLNCCRHLHRPCF